MLWYPYSLIPDGKKRHSRIWPKWVQLNMAWFSRSRVFNKGRFRFPVWRNFGNSTYTQWNGTFRLHRPEPSNHAFGYCSCKQDTKTAVLRTTIWQMERVISSRPTEITRPVKVEHLQSWSRVFRSDQTEMVCSNWCTNRQFRNFELKGKRP